MHRALRKEWHENESTLASWRGWVPGSLNWISYPCQNHLTGTRCIYLCLSNLWQFNQCLWVVPDTFTANIASTWDASWCWLCQEKAWGANAIAQIEVASQSWFAPLWRPCMRAYLVTIYSSTSCRDTASCRLTFEGSTEEWGELNVIGGSWLFEPKNCQISVARRLFGFIRQILYRSSASPWTYNDIACPTSK
jgi:hypothetical protein